MKSIKYIFLLFGFTLACTEEITKSQSEPAVNQENLEYVEPSFTAFPTDANCDIKYDTVQNKDYLWHQLILNQSKNPEYGRDIFRDGKKINKYLYPQDIIMFTTSLNPKENEFYKTLTNKVVYYLIENEFKILAFGLNRQKTENINYFFTHVEHPICNSITIDSIITRITTEMSDTIEGEKQLKNTLLDRLNKAKNRN